MAHRNDLDPPTPSTPAPRGDARSGRRRRLRSATLAVAAVVGALVVAPHTALSPSAGPDMRWVDAPAPTPPEGMVWVQGTLTDQAGHALDNVNVEVWPDDPTALEPVASNLTYAGVPADARHNHGVYRVEVPSNTPYRLVFSGVHNSEDGDAYRIQRYGGGRPIVVRPGTARAGTALLPGRVRDLGTTALVHQGRVGSAVRLTATKVRAGKRGTLHLRVTSHYVRDVTGPVVIRAAGHRVTRRLIAADHGKLTTRLPAFHRAGKHPVSARFQGSSTVAKSARSTVKVTVKKRR